MHDTYEYNIAYCQWLILPLSEDLRKSYNLCQERDNLSYNERGDLNCS